MQTLFRWIHLSDIHVGHGDAGHAWDQRFVMEALRTDVVAETKRAAAKVDAIFVTGDIAFSGNARVRKPDTESREYAGAATWLLALGEAVGLGPSQIFVVPGNHDVNRGADADPDVKRLADALREGHEAIDTALTDRGNRALLARRMQAYLDFAAAFAPACLRAPDAPEERLYWVHRAASASGMWVRILGLNTALLAAIDDRRKLRLGRAQLAEALTSPPIADDELVLALSHHPLRGEWLADERDADAWVRNRAHVHLSGHVHEADTELARSGAGGSLLRIVAGATHGDQGEPVSHGYSFGEVVRDDGGRASIRVFPRAWSPKSADFRVDVHNVPDGLRYAEHPIRLVLPSKPAVARTEKPSATNPAPGLTAPLRVFISSAPEDEKLCAKLEKHLKPLQRSNRIVVTSAASLPPGADVAAAVRDQLRTAQVILLLVSPDSLGSDAWCDVEMKEAVARHERGEARVVPILLRPSDFKDAPFAHLRFVPPYPGSAQRPPEPVTSFGDVDEALQQVARGVRDAVDALLARRG